MKTRLFPFITITCLLLGVACGDEGEDAGAQNQASCESLEKQLADCDATLQGSLGCGNFANTTCDVSDYFACLETAYGSCEGGVFAELDAQALGECAQKARCD